MEAADCDGRGADAATVMIIGSRNRILGRHENLANQGPATTRERRSYPVRDQDRIGLKVNLAIVRDRLGSMPAGSSYLCLSFRDASASA